MAQRPLKIPMDKSRQPKLGITVRDGDAKGVLDVTLLGPNNAPYDLTDKQVVFREEKENNKWIEDSTNINIDDAPRGHFTYVLHQQAQVIGNGRAWFKVISSDGTIDSSQDFYITVEKGFNMAITNSNYISEFEDVRKKLNSIETDADTSYKAELQSLKDRGNKAIDDVEAAYQKAASGFQTAFNTAESNRKTADDNAEQARQTEYESDKKTRDDTYNADKQKRDSDWSASLADIKKAASDQQDAIKQAADTQSKQIQDAADKQISDNQTSWNTEKQNLIDDWNTTKNGFQSTLSDLQTTVDSLKTSVDQLNKTDLPNAQQKMDALNAEIQKAEQTFSKVDFSKFVTGDQFKAVQDELAAKTSGTIVTAYDIASKNPTTETNSYTSEELVGQGVLGQFADQINQLKGRRAIDAPDFDALTDSGIYFISNPRGGKNYPSTNWGTLAVFTSSQGSAVRATQIYAADNCTDAFMRTYGYVNNDNVLAWGSWHQIAWKSDLTGYAKTVSLNGGDKVAPDNGGNIDLTVPQPDLTGYAKTADVNAQFTTVNGQIKELQSRQSTFTPITQAEYDALPEDEKANGMYAIGDSN